MTRSSEAHDLIIKELGQSRLKDAGRCNSEFIVDSQLVLHAKNNQIGYTVIDRPPTRKRYDQNDLDYSTYIGRPDRVVFLAYIEGTVAGQITLRKQWNTYAFIDELVVDVAFRRLGVGQALMAQAKAWATEKHLPGIVAETQTNNVHACRFYERCGFEIGGFDTSLYRGTGTNIDEVAVFWYFHLIKNERQKT